MAKRGHGDGSIYRRSDGRWAASLSLDHRQRKTFYGKTRKEVQDKLKVALYEQRQGLLMVTPQQTIEQFFGQWLESHKAAATIRMRSYERYEEIVRLHILPLLGSQQLQKLTAQQVQAAYTHKLGEGLSASTVRAIHSLLHHGLDDAVRLGVITRNVCDAVKPPRKVRYEIQPFSIEQAQQFLAAVSGHPLEALFVLAITTGMRRGEILGLKWQDIDFQHMILHVRRILSRIPTTMPGKGFVEAEPKTEKSRRSIPLAPVVIPLLKHHRACQQAAKLRAGATWQERGLVFCSALGTPLNPNRVIEHFKKLLQKAGLPMLRFHDLRHSAATILLSMEVHPKVVQEMLGHHEISMTMDIYSHVLPTIQRDAVNKLDTVLQSKVVDASM